MKDMLAHLQTLRAQIAECERLQRASKGRKREIFCAGLVARYTRSADELEQAIEASRTKRRKQ
jgi:hypothetical protein